MRIFQKCHIKYYKYLKNIFFLLMLFIPWYTMTFAEFRENNSYIFPDIMDVLMRKALIGSLIVYFCSIIIVIFVDRFARDTIWKRLCLKENLTVFAICSYEYFLIYAFVVIRNSFNTVVLTTVSLSDAILGWIISLIFLYPFYIILTSIITMSKIISTIIKR